MNITPEKRALLQRAISDPVSISPEENEILWLPPPDEEAQLHQSIFNLPSRAALVAKALPNDGADLIDAETTWLQRLGSRNPFVKEEPLDVVNSLQRRLDTPWADRGLIADAHQSVMTADEIPEGVRSDVFLVVEKKALSNEQVITGERYFHFREPRKTAYLRAVDPDHDPATPVPLEGNYAGFNGEITVPLPKVFDWLYYTLFSGSESWKIRYWQTTTKEWRPDVKSFSPYPGY